MSRLVALALFVVGLTTSRLSTVGQSLSKAPNKVIATYDNRSFSNPVRLPGPILTVLLRQKETSYAQDGARNPPGGDASRFFRAISVQLTPSGQNDWIVNGIFPLAGADSDWFWIIHGEPSGPKVILFYNGNTISILNTETNGLRDIQATWESPSERDKSLYQYGETKYKLVRRYSNTR